MADRHYLCNRSECPDYSNFFLIAQLKLGDEIMPLSLLLDYLWYLRHVFLACICDNRYYEPSPDKMTCLRVIKEINCVTHGAD